MECPKRLLRMIASGLIAMALTAFYWLPAMEQVAHITFRAQKGSIYHIAEHVLSPTGLLKSLGMGMVMVQILAIALGVVLLLRDRRVNRDALSLTINFCLLDVLACCKPLWIFIGERADFLQFTERLIPMSGCLSCLAVACCTRALLAPEGVKTEEVTGRALWRRGLPIACAIVIGGFLLSGNAAYHLEDPWRPTWTVSSLLSEVRGIGAGGEWLPASCWEELCDEPALARDPQGGGAYGVKHDSGKSFDVYVSSRCDYYDMPYVYYYGYRAYLLEEDGTPAGELATAEAQDDNGLVRVFLPETAEEILHILVLYRKTTIQKASLLFSCVFFVALCFGWLWRRRSREIVR